MKYIGTLLIYVTLQIYATFSLKLNVPRILLPIFNDFSSQFTLEATEGGCFKWSSTGNDIISLEPIDVNEDADCSAKVIVHAVTKQWSRNIAVVLAEDMETQHVLRCDVIVDVIDKLSIVTTTKEIFMEEAPEAFEVRAYDKQDNEFTSLQGVEFDWQWACLGPNKDVVVISSIAFKDSPYETPPTVAELQEQNKNGHIILLEGVKTGSAKVSVRFAYEEYKHIETIEVYLNVLANLIIMPSNIFVMAGDTVSFQVIQLNNGRMDPIELPHVEYYLSSEDETVAMADPYSGEVTALANGFTRIILRNKNMEENPDITVKLPAAIMQVVTPAYMTIHLLPHKNWAVLQSEHHDIITEVYSSDNKKLYLGQNIEIHTQVGEIFHVQQRSKNGSWLTGWAKQEGVAKVQGVLETIESPKVGVVRLDPAIRTQADLLVFPPITLTPCEVILPWDTLKKPRYQVDVTASGGDGKFLWSSSNHSIGVVTQLGHVRTHSLGTFEVSAAMMRNHHNRESTTFHILYPVRLEIVEFAMEAEVGAFIYLHIALYAEKTIKGTTEKVQIPFTSCQELKFKVKTSNANFYYNRTATISPVGISCANIAIIGSQVGVSKVTISYISDSHLLEDSVTISTFKPLKLLYPQNCQVVLAVGASTNVLFTGGPRPIAGLASLHVRTVRADQSTTVAAREESLPSEQQNFIVINVLCLKLGESDVILTVTNTPTLPKCKNQEGSAIIRVICGKPRTIALQPEIYTEPGACPMDLSAQRVVVQSNKDVELSVTVLDENGLAFLNISTFKFEWSLKPPQLATLGVRNGIFQRNITEGGVVIANRSYQIVMPIEETGVLEVTCKIVGYHVSALYAYGISPEYPLFVTEDDPTDISLPVGEIHLYLVKDATVTPNILSIYNHPDNMKKLTVLQGSGYFQLAQSDTEIAKVEYFENSREIEILPMKDGELRLTLTDLCLATKPCSVNIDVVSVRTIKIEMSDKVEIGKCISCIVKLYDAFDNLVNIPSMKMIDLTLNLDADIAKFKLLTNEDTPWPVGEIHYVVTGIELGEAEVMFSINDVRSAPINLQVFPPLRIYPRNTTLLIGSYLQLSSKGGPQPDAEMEYIVSYKGIADVNTKGLLKGLALGDCRVTARAVGVNPTTGTRVVYSNDSVDVHVVPITGIKISMPLTRFRVGATVPAWCSGLPDQLSPMILGTLNPPMEFEWEIQDIEVINIHTPFEIMGIEYSPEDNVAVRIKGLHPGRTTLHLTAQIAGAAANYASRPHFVFTTSVDIEVFDHLVLISPISLPDSSILMAPHSSHQLETNLDLENKIYYSLLSSNGLPTENDAATEKSLSIPNPIVTLTETGLLESHEEFGRVMIIVSARDDYGLKQTLSIIVEVKPIHYMLLHLVTYWRVGTSSPAKAVPLGTDLTLRTTYHDNTGATFTIGSSNLGLRSSRFDLTRIRLGNDNASVMVSLRKQGVSVIKVWADGLHRTADYIKLNVDQLISPVTDHLVTGDIICMYTPLESSSKEALRWTSSERSLLVIDAESGIGYVTGIKGGQIVIAHSLHPSASLNLKVVPATQITLLPELPKKALTNSANTKMYRIPLLITSQFTKRDRNLLNGWSCEDEVAAFVKSFPFTCHIEFLNSSINTHASAVFKIDSGFDPTIGKYTCDLIPEDLYSPNVSTLRSNIAVWAELLNSDIESDPVEVLFLPSIYVENELILDDKYQANLVIYGIEVVLNNVEVKATDKKLLEVGKAARTETYILTHTITLVDYHWKLIELAEPLSLTVTSKLTGETIKVYVRTEGAVDLFDRCPAGGDRSPLLAFIKEHRDAILIVLSMLIIFIITFYAYSRYIQPVVNVNVSTDMAQPRVCGARATPYVSDRCIGARQSSTSPSNTRNISYTNRDSTFGDPSAFYCTSPDLRRNRRFL